MSASGAMCIADAIQGEFGRETWMSVAISHSTRLVGSLLVSDEPQVAVATDSPNVIFYDPFSPESVMVTDSGTQERIQKVSAYFQYRFHSAFSANFNGDAGGAGRPVAGLRERGEVDARHMR